MSQIGASFLQFDRLMNSSLFGVSSSNPTRYLRRFDLLDAFDTAVSILERFPYSNKVYQPIMTFKDEYRLLPVNNSVVLYVVIDQVVEIRRIVYAKMDLTKIIR
ncbi:hypothetical protein [Tepidibacillus marianensis]|uniref:type II toxin-antitoxin system RelE/ParE family toxin n=1 Tax=Tepidibacillus marianensis TaxID=3131995 RepID=UPI0030D59C0C